MTPAGIEVYVMYSAAPDLRSFVQSLPKTETHLHLEGACPAEVVRRRAPGLLERLPDFQNPAFRFQSFAEFTGYFAQVAEAVFTSAEAFHESAQGVFSRCWAQNCRYVECSFNLGLLAKPGMPSGPEVLAAILEAAPQGLEVRVFAGMRHNSYDALTAPLIEACLEWEDLAGVDLHGPEDLPLEPWTADVWRRAREAGKYCKAHAGEFMPASFVRRVVEELGVIRIEHGVRAIEDPALITLLRERGIALDICPISNLKLQVEGVAHMQNHPIRLLFDAGVRCTVNTDDPLFFGNTLCEEYYALAEAHEFTRAELAQIARNGFEIALWEGPERDACLATLDLLVSSSDR